MDTLDAIIKFESGEATEDEVITLCQKLVNTGQAWKLQGSYGRLCSDLLDAGLITSPFEVVS